MQLLFISLTLLILAACLVAGFRLYQTKRHVSDLYRGTELILQNIDAYVLLIDREFNVVHTNYYMITGTPAAAVPPKVGNLLHCRNGEDAGCCGTHELCASCPVRAAIEEAFRSGENFFGLEVAMELYTSANPPQTITCDVSITGSHLPIEKKHYLLLTIHDITSQKQARRELIEAKTKAEESDRMKSTFLANISHEIRTPLNAILGFSELLATASTQEESEVYLRFIRTNNELLLQLINDILDMSKIEAGTLEFSYAEEELNTILEELEDVCRLQLPESAPIRIEFRREYPSCRFRTDRKRLTQVLSNFLSNAMKFTSRGQIVFGYQMHDGELYFYVSDTGDGIPQENLEQVFHRFVKLSIKKSGSGIGLAICKSIVETMGGRIGVESEEGKGSTFWFTLPSETRS